MPIIDVHYDAENNMHPRNLQEIIGFADKGLGSKRDTSPIRISYKTKINPLTEKPIFGRSKAHPYNHS